MELRFCRGLFLLPASTISIHHGCRGNTFIRSAETRSAQAAKRARQEDTRKKRPPSRKPRKKEAPTPREPARECFRAEMAAPRRESEPQSESQLTRPAR